MNKIKFLSAIIFSLLVVLALFSKYTATQNSANLNLLKTINEQKAFTQEISKNIFYIYKNKNASSKQLNESIKLFINNMNNRDEILNTISSNEILLETKQIVELWNGFYLLVQKFRENNKIHNPYTNLILEEIVNNIYRKNIRLVYEFNKLLSIHKKYYDAVKERNKVIQLSLFAILILLLIYLFTQLKDLISFIQKFLNTSKNIIQNRTIKGAEPIELESSMKLVTNASDNFNCLIENIDNSIENASQSMQNSTHALEQIEINIDDLLELIAVMDGEELLDRDLTKKEDILIESLDEISNSLQKLQTLQKRLDNFKKRN